MKHENMTFSIPHDLKVALHSRIRKRGVSKFVSEAIRKSLEEEESEIEKELDAAYEAANHDLDRIETLQEWNRLDDVMDLHDQEDDWEWLKKSEKR